VHTYQLTVLAGVAPAWWVMSLVVAWGSSVVASSSLAAAAVVEDILRYDTITHHWTSLLSTKVSVFYLYKIVTSQRWLTHYNIFTVAICYRPSVRLSSVCVLSVTFVHPT